MHPFAKKIKYFPYYLYREPRTVWEDETNLQRHIKPPNGKLFLAIAISICNEPYS